MNKTIHIGNSTIEEADDEVSRVAEPSDYDKEATFSDKWGRNHWLVKKGAMIERQRIIEMLEKDIKICDRFMIQNKTNSDEWLIYQNRRRYLQELIAKIKEMK